MSARLPAWRSRSNNEPTCVAGHIHREHDLIGDLSKQGQDGGSTTRFGVAQQIDSDIAASLIGGGSLLA